MGSVRRFMGVANLGLAARMRWLGHRWSGFAISHVEYTGASRPPGKNRISEAPEELR